MTDRFVVSSGRRARQWASRGRQARRWAFGGVGVMTSLLFILSAVAHEAHGQTGGTISLVGQLNVAPGGPFNSDIWGWVDPVTQKEYAIMGEWGGREVHIIDVSDPANPVVVSVLNTLIGFDVKTWDHYLYLVSGSGSGSPGQIWDIANPAAPVFAGNFLTGHNITISESGIMFNSVNGLNIFDLNPDPASPTFVWFDGINGGHDVTVVGNRMYDFHGTTGTFIYDITDLSSPVQLGSILRGDGNGIVFHHSGWTSADEQFLFINDELGDTLKPDITVWDISNAATPVVVDSFTDPNATIHNGFRIGDFYYTSFYVAGFRVFDISDPSNMFLADEFDTSPEHTGNKIFRGAWGCYPFAPSGNIYVSDMQNGLFIFRFEPNATDNGTPTQVVLKQNFPNPFNPSTTIPYELPVDGRVRITVFDGLGHRVRRLVNERESAGPHSETWDGRDEGGRPVASGIYFYKLESRGTSVSRRMVLLK